MTEVNMMYNDDREKLECFVKCFVVALKQLLTLADVKEQNEAENRVTEIYRLLPYTNPMIHKLKSVCYCDNFKELADSLRMKIDLLPRL